MNRPLTPTEHFYQSVFTGPVSEPSAKVWHVELDGRQITVIDPDWLSVEEMQSSLWLKFGRERVGKVEEMGCD